MDLVNEQHVALFQVGEQRREIAGLRDHRTGGGAEVDTELARDDLCERGLAEARRANKQHVIEWLAPGARRLDEHREITTRLLLANELGELLRAQRGFGDVLVAVVGGDEAGRGGHGMRSPSSPGTSRPSRLTARSRVTCPAP